MIRPENRLTLRNTHIYSFKALSIVNLHIYAMAGSHATLSHTLWQACECVPVFVFDNRLLMFFSGLCGG